MKKLPLGISTFSEIITGNYVYVDKTEFAWNLITNGKYYFLSRPRRFGKSLLVDTLKCIFENRKELFLGLYIEDKRPWNTIHPVITVNYTDGVIDGRKLLDKKTINIFRTIAEKNKIELQYDNDVSDIFKELIVRLHEKYNQKVVILVDEYDKPILDNITEFEVAREVREGLKNIYSVIKGQDAHIEFAFLTGVSKFSKVSLFSGLNNLEDITIDERYATICGYTHGNLENNFGQSFQDVDLDEVRKWYNGYNWQGESVYNPFDILLFLTKGKSFRNYWFETATPTFLIELFKKKNFYIPNLENIEVSESLLGSFDIDFIEPETILFQTGYLTIASSRRVGPRLKYKLKYPNIEVQYSLNDYILDYLIEDPAGKSKHQNMIYESLEVADFDWFKRGLHKLFASIPYNNFTNNQICEYEGYYASVMYSYFAALGIDLIGEDVTNKGRIDLTLKFPDYIFIIEFKVIEEDDLKGTALAQIKEKKYYEKYVSAGKEAQKIFLLGIDFSKKQRNIADVRWEEV